MPVTVNHVLSATTPDNPSYEIQPQHWNSAHSVVLNISGTDIIGAFSNANGVSFGTSAGYVTASHNALTTAAQSNHSHGNPTLALTNISGTTASASNGLTLSLSAAAPGGAASATVYGVGNSTVNSSGTVPLSALSMRGYGVLSIGTSNGSVLFSTPDAVDFTQLSVGFSTGGNTAGDAGLVTGRMVLAGGANITLSGSTNGGSQTISIVGGGGGGGAAISAGTQSVSTGTVVYSNSNNITFGMSGSSRVTAQAALNLYATGNTTNNSSTVLPIDAVSINAQGALTAGYSNGSVQLSAPATSSLSAGANITISTNGSTISIIGASVAASPVSFSAGTSSAALQSLVFSNSNGVSFGLNGSTITGSHNALTTAALSDHSHGDPTLALTNLSGTTASASNGLTLSLSAAAQSVQPVAISGSNGSFTFSTVSFGTGNGMSFYSSNGSIVGSHNGLTTAAQSDHSHGNPTLNLTNLSGTTASNSAGFTLSLSAAAPGAALAASASNGSFTFSTLGFSNANNVTFGTSAGSIITASVAAPGAALENNNHNLLGANTAGNTTASGSTIGFSGINLTLSGTNGSVINFSAPATSSIVGASGISVSTNGSTISIGQVLQSYYHNFGGIWPNSTTMTVAQSTSHLIPFYVPEPISFDFVRMPMTASMQASSTAATTGNSQFSYGVSRTTNFVIYSRGAGGNSQSLQYVASTQASEQQSINVSAAANSTQFSYTNRATYPMSTGQLGFTWDYSSSAASLNFHTSGMTAVSGLKMMEFPFGTTLSAGQYWLAYGVTSTSASQYTSVGARLFNSFSNYGMSMPNLAFGTIGAATNSSVSPFFGAGSFTTSGAAGTTASVPFSVISSSGSHNRMMFELVRIA